MTTRLRILGVTVASKFLSTVILALGLSQVNAQPLENPFYENSYAVVVGIDDYTVGDWTPLKYAVRDAQGMTAMLEERGFEVISLLDEEATRQRILTVLRNDIAPKLQENDRVIFFFAGHGYTERLDGRDHGYIVPFDGESIANFIPHEDLRRQSRLLNGAKHQLFIMDACFGGLLTERKLELIEPKHPRYLTEVTGRISKNILTAGGPDQIVADDGPDGHSVFTGQLLKAIRDGLADLNGDNWITFSELQAYITHAASSELQTPLAASFYGDQGGEMVFRSSLLVANSGGRDVPTYSLSQLRSLSERGGVASFSSAGDNTSVELNLRLDNLVCEASNDPLNEDEIYVEIEGSLSNSEPYSKRLGTWEKICKADSELRLPQDLWSGLIPPGERLLLNVRIREEDVYSGPEDVLAFQFDAAVDEAGRLEVQVAGLPVLEDTQRDSAEMAITLVRKPGARAGSRQAILSVDYTRESLWLDKRVAYNASVSW